MVDCLGLTIGVKCRVMKTIIALCLVGVACQAGVIIESAAPGGYGVTTGGAAIHANQWAGFGFELTQETTITYGGAHIYSHNADTTVFLTLVPLDGPGDLPNGNPFDIGEVIGSTLLTPVTSSPSYMRYAELSLTLSPGYYGAIIGSGALGASGEVAAPDSGVNVLSDTFSRNSAGWNGFGFPLVRIELGDGPVPSSVPEPASLMAFTGICFGFFGVHFISKRLRSQCN